MPPLTLPHATRRWIAPALLLLLLAPLKLVTLPGHGPFLFDASYYYQIARHVAEGDGLLTSVSLYHEGLDPLPAPARIYPLWPLVLGLVGRVVGILDAARLLPSVFFFLDLVLLHALGLRLVARMARPGTTDSWLPPTLLVAAFSANYVFWLTTSEPYTEGLAFALAIGSLLCLDRLADRASLPWAVACGVLAGLAYLARSQMLLLIAAIGLTLAAAAWTVRNLRGPVAAYALGVVAAVLPWRIFLATHPLERKDIGTFVTWVESGSPASYLMDRLPGLVVAFDPRSSLSYFNSFGPAVLLVPVALLWALWDLRRNRSLNPQVSWLLPAAAALTGAANHAALVHRHAEFFLPWLFGWRHGLGFLFLLAVAAFYLMARPQRWIRLCTMLVLAATALAGWARVYATLPSGMRPSSAEAQLIRWVDSRPTPPVMLTTRAQTLGMLSRGRFHWAVCEDAPAQTRLMLARLPITHVVLYDRDRDCTVTQGLQDVLEVDRWFVGSSQEEPILLLRRRGAEPRP